MKYTIQTLICISWEKFELYRLNQSTQGVTSTTRHDEIEWEHFRECPSYNSTKSPPYTETASLV